MQSPPKAPDESTIASSPGEVTDVAFWDAQWNDRAGRSLSQRVLHGRDFGRHGLFLKVIDRYVGLANIHQAKLVEFGGAASRFLLDFALHVQAKVTAVDYSPVGIAATQEMFNHHGVVGDAIQADMFDWDIEPGSFDVATHWGLLEHFDDPAPVLRASARAVRKGGLVVFSMPNMGAAGARLWARYAPDNYSKHIYHSEAVIAQVCESEGLRLETVFHFGAPLLRMATPERSSAGALIANVLHAGVSVVGTLAPGLYVRGHPMISNTRGFVLRRH